jgi:hypothetical protein
MPYDTHIYKETHMNKITAAEAKQVSIQMRKELEVKFFSNQLSLAYEKIKESSMDGYLHCEYSVPTGNVNIEEIVTKIESTLREDGFSVSRRDSTSHHFECILTIGW